MTPDPVTRPAYPLQRHDDARHPLHRIDAFT